MISTPLRATLADAMAFACALAVFFAVALDTPALALPAEPGPMVSPARASSEAWTESRRVESSP